MIESQLDPIVDGVGGGEYDSDLTIAQIAAQFRYLAAEGRGRSAAGVLRIVREQSSGRNGYAGLLPCVIAIFVFSLLLCVGLLNASPDYRARTESGLWVILLLNAIFGAGAWITNGRRKRSVAQLRELRRLALLTLDQIVPNKGFRPKPFDKDERKTFLTLRRIDSAAWNRVARRLMEGAE